jgi:trimethylamine---corrinoid protein Co-methyltransferase
VTGWFVPRSSGSPPPYHGSQSLDRPTERRRVAMTAIEHPAARRGRAARQTERLARSMETLPYLTRKLAPVEVVSTEGLEQIEHNADTLLQDVGIEIGNFPEALEIFRNAGADVTGTRVRFERGMCRGIIQASAPKVFTQRARNPKRSVVIGDPYVVLVPTYGSPFIHNLDEGRRYATIEDFRNFVKLTYMNHTLHHGGGTLCEPVDLPVNKRHIEMVYSHIRYTDKAFMGSVTHPSRAQDSVDMVKVLFGADTLDRDHVIMGLANANSPMSWDFNMLGSAKVYAENNQIMLITPFILGGAMAPVTVAASATQTLAEALAGMAFCQIVRPGAPVIFGSFASSMSMQTGAPTFGTPEPQLVLYVLAALSRRLGVPFRSGGNFTASKLPDYQAAYESAVSFMSTMQAGVNFNLHTAGWLEGGLAIGYEKFILDADQASMAGAFLAGVDLTDNGYALQAMLDGGPGQHFLGSPHTLANFETAFWRSEISNNDSFEQWQLDGSLDAAQRANVRWKRQLADYEEPGLDEAVHEELREWMDKRRASFPDSDV